MERWEGLELPEGIELTPELRSAAKSDQRSKETLVDLIQAAKLAILDPVTSTDERPVYNQRGFNFEKRRYFATGLPEALAQRVGVEERRQGDKHDFSLLLLDLYNFGGTNERMQHLPANEVLRYVANRLLDCLRETDRLCRWGGDEYAVFLQAPYPDHTAPYTDSKVIPQRLARVLYANTHLLPEGAKPFGFYGGLATSLEAFERGFTDPDELFGLADSRLTYIAKRHTYKHDESTIVGENDEVIFRAPIVRPVAATP